MPSRKKQKKQPETEEAEENAVDNEDPPVEEQEAEEAEGEDGADDEEGGEENGGDEEGEENATAAEKLANAKKRRRAVARRKGYRLLATKGGYSVTSAALDPSRNVARNILTLAEVGRAAKWSPQLPEYVTYGNTKEFQERLMLSQEPLARGPQAVIRASAEIFARKVVNDCMVRTFETGKTRVSLSTMTSVLAPMASTLHFNFLRPQGLLRHAQTTTVGSNDKTSPALGVYAMDEAQMKVEQEGTVHQKELFKKAVKAADARRKERVAKRNGAHLKARGAAAQATAA